VPMTPDGLRACRTLSSNNIPVNVTLIFSANQAVLAAKSGAKYVSPFIGRLDDIGHDGMDLIRTILEIFGNYDFDTQVLVASIRHPLHVVEAARLGAHVVTLPPQVLDKMLKHPLTDIGLKSFLSDWRLLQKSQK
ncbi:MAG: fructose-6-phosphate aldolase, partial [Cenarchaeum sp. SB0672_bin_9]|nr:fructose-6-phosphate aldolase [Cenarchaeum sp. SB0672_bin_9]